MNHTFVTLVAFVLLVAASTAFAQGKGSRGRRPSGSRRGSSGSKGSSWGWGKRKDPYGGDPEKAFFCQMSYKACSLTASDGTTLVERSCAEDAPCNSGSSGVIKLGDESYDITFCPVRTSRPDPYRKLIDYGRGEEPTAALSAKCPMPKKPPSNMPLWFMIACKVTGASGQDVKPERPCFGRATCTKGTYDAQYKGEEVKVTFCDYGRQMPPQPPPGEAPEPIWLKAACSVATPDGTMVEQEDCEGDANCSVRLTEVGEEEVSLGYCDGQPIWKAYKKGGKGKPAGAR